MKKNVALQVIGCQMTSDSHILTESGDILTTEDGKNIVDESFADGSAFVGTVTVYVTGDNGLQTIGATGGGVCTHKGNGYYTYVPTQAETNYGHVAFTFIGTGAVTRTIQIYPSLVGGDGSHPHAYAVTDSVSGLGISGVTVVATSDIAGLNEVLRTVTNGAGVATFHFDAAGTYYFWSYKSPYEFINPDSEAVI